jgi:hypothetical protein
MLLIVIVHVAGVVVSSWLHHENLIRSMLTGHKLATVNEGISKAWKLLAAVIILGVLAFWYMQWQSVAGL